MLNIVSERFSLSVDLTKSNLTLAERDIIRLLLSGFSVTEISRLKNRKVKTISNQKQNAYKKLDIRNDVNLFSGLINQWGMEVKNDNINVTA
ncbi:helix-turn-helix transcriptional regulator [Escherichia coli]|uniref:helix-turn-helix transcriptional regulator n=2 Tax=Escherichia coli TaxID=562 RepID=UPI000E1D4AC1|nr:LuxR C-terminal-related transcriptional regulator [Escherichia coli]RDP93657.1 Transcriptional regulatory protein RcsB [Escherichia coli]